MKISNQKQCLLVSDISELNATNASQVKSEIREALTSEHTRIDLDLSTTRFVDSSGLGVLIGLHKSMAARQGTIRILNPTGTVQQVLELTRLHRLFEILQP